MRLSWGCDNFKAKNIFILSQTEPWEILVRVAIPTRTACARGYSHAHNTLILVYISVRVAIATRTCAWLSHAHVYSIQIRLLEGGIKDEVIEKSLRELKLQNKTKSKR